MNVEDHLCFALYATNHAMSRLYRPLLDPLGLTYPQYLVLMALWQNDGQSVGDLGRVLALESNTLTPLLKRMQSAGLIERARGADDERMVFVSLTDQGRALQSASDHVTRCVLEASGLNLEEVQDLREKINLLRARITEFAGAGHLVQPDLAPGQT